MFYGNHTPAMKNGKMSVGEAGAGQPLRGANNVPAAKALTHHRHRE